MGKRNVHRSRIAGIPRVQSLVCRSAPDAALYITAPWSALERRGGSTGRSVIGRRRGGGRGRRGRRGRRGGKKGNGGRKDPIMWVNSYFIFSFLFTTRFDLKFMNLLYLMCRDPN